IPSWRLDLNLEIDLIEEIARTLGYDRIPVQEQIEIRLTPPNPRDQATERIRSTLVAAGYFEAVTFSWVADNLAGDFLPPGAASLPRAEHTVRKADANLRPSLIPGLLEAVRRNESAGTPDARLFEIGSTFQVDSAGKLIETRKLALAGPSDLRQLRGAIETMLRKLDGDKPI